MGQSINQQYDAECRETRLYEVNVDMVTGIASQTRMLLPDGNVVQFSLRDN